MMAGCEVHYRFISKEKDDELRSIREYRLLIKQEDEQTQYSYFGARYYDSDLSVWLSVDPMSDSRSWISPYNYCQWNPVGRVDPSGALDGLNDDGYTVDLQGNIEWVDETGGDSYDVVFNKADYEAGKRDYDESGTKSGMKIARGEISNFQNLNYDVQNPWGEHLFYATRSNCEIKTKEVADNLFKFLAYNTLVEWANQNYSRPDGTSLNVITTSREGGDKGTVRGLLSLTLNYLNKGYTLNSDDHSHPYDYEFGYLTSDVTGDAGYKNDILTYQTKRQVENAKFRVLWRGKFISY